MMIALTFTAAALAQAALPPKLGEPWIGADGNQREATIGLQIDRSAEPDPELVRGLEINWKDFPYQQGRFPVAVADADESNVGVGITLDVAATGVPQSCRVVTPSGTAAFDDHACPHLMRYLRFYPALNRSGTRLGGTLAIRVRYTAGRVRIETAAGGVVPMVARPTPRPLTPINAATVGFGPGDGLPPTVYGTSGSLRVEADGSVSGCMLAAPTQVDAFDVKMCERLRAVKFEPARERDGRPIPSRYSFGMSRPR
jgi:hypothetical protein